MQETPGMERGADAPPPDDPNAAVPAMHPAAAESASAALAPRPMHQLGAAAEAGAVALTAQIEGNLKARYGLARMFPRNWDDVRLKLVAAMRRPILAETAMYSKPIGDEKVRGLSIRFAEEAFRAMGNIDLSQILVSDDADKRVYVVTGIDLETLASVQITVVVTKQIERSSMRADSVILGRRTNSRGKTTYILKATSEDDYRAKEMALIQKGRRDAVLFLTPGDIKEECEIQIKKTVADRDAKDPQGAILRMTEAFFSFGITVAEVEKMLGHAVRSTNAAEMQRCREILTALKDGETTWGEVMDAKFGGTNTGADAESGSTVDRLKDAIAKEPAKSEAKPDAKAEAKPPLVEIPARIQKMFANETVPGALTDEDREELRQFRTDHAHLFPGHRGKVEAKK